VEGERGGLFEKNPIRAIKSYGRSGRQKRGRSPFLMKRCPEGEPLKKEKGDSREGGSFLIPARSTGSKRERISALL